MRKGFERNKPHLIVIAGPNGAGKSITSRKILRPYGIEAFDWDYRFQRTWKKFHCDPIVIEGIRQSTNKEFHQHINASFENLTSVAYETNFHSIYNIELAERAKKLSFTTSLYFLALNKPELGIHRVAERVRQGGHHVDENTIRERYRLGLELLDNQALNCFNRIYIYDSGNIFKLLLILEDASVIYKSDTNTSILDNLPRIKSICDN